MPRAGFKKSQALAIELDGEMSTHLPGDTLTGYVTIEKSPDIEAPYTPPVQLKLFGRVKTKYKVQRQQGTSIYRGRAVLFETSFILSKSKICQNGQHAWPFSTPIPKSSQPGFAGRGHEFTAFEGYLHTKGVDKKETDVTKHGLPSTLYYTSKTGMGSYTVEAYIEYVLVATHGENTAYHPIYVRKPSVPSPVANFKMRNYADWQPDVINSLKLLPEHADKKLTFGQKSSRFFRPGKVPRYTYTVNVEYPQLIQLEHPDPIPLKIYIVPDLEPRKTTICPDNDISTLPPVQVISVEMVLKGAFSIRCPGTLWDTDTTTHHKFTFSLPMEIKPITIPVVQPFAKPDLLQNPSAEFASVSTLSPASSVTLENCLIASQTQPSPAGPTALNLGAHLSILLGCSAASTCGQRAVSFKRQVYPTFASYNISLKYRLEWKIKMVCAEKKTSISGEYPVVVLAPSEEQESQKTREMGTEGMKKNYDDLEQGLGAAMQLVGGILQVVGG